MKLVQWLARGIAPGGRLMEAGEQMLLGDDVILGAHQVDLTAFNAAAPVAAPEPTPVADVMAEMGAKHPRMVTPEGVVLAFDPARGGYFEEAKPEALTDEPAGVPVAAPAPADAEVPEAPPPNPDPPPAEPPQELPAGA